MQKSTMRWGDLRLFLELVRKGSARAAATTMNMSHSTVVRRVERLETSLGVRLFDRDFTGYRPTSAGETLMTSALAAEEAILTADRQLHGQDAQLKGGIHITTSDILANYFLTTELARFGEVYSEIEFQVSVSYDVFDLTRREADVALRFIGSGRNPPEDLVGRKLLKASSCYYATERYLETHDLSSENTTARWIGWDDDEPYPWWVKESPFSNVPAHGHFNNAMLQAFAVQSDLGIASLPCFAGDKIPGVIRIPDCEPFPNYDVWMLSHPDLRDAARHRAFRKFLSESFETRKNEFLGIQS